MGQSKNTTVIHSVKNFPEPILFSVLSHKWVIPMLSKSVSLEYEELFYLIQKALPLLYVELKVKS